MSDLNEHDVIKKYVQNLKTANFEINKRGSLQNKEAISESLCANKSNLSNDTKSGRIGLDSVRSCESVFKIFSFEPARFDENNEKCVQFWKLIDADLDLKPVDCVIMDAHLNKRQVYCQTEGQESEGSLWARALFELRQKKLDKLALTSKIACKYCDGIPSYRCSGYLESELVDKEDLTQLNNWSPKSQPENILPFAVKKLPPRKSSTNEKRKTDFQAFSTEIATRSEVFEPNLQSELQVIPETPSHEEFETTSELQVRPETLSHEKFETANYITDKLLEGIETYETTKYITDKLLEGVEAYQATNYITDKILEGIKSDVQVDENHIQSTNCVPEICAIPAFYNNYEKINCETVNCTENLDVATSIQKISSLLNLGLEEERKQHGHKTKVKKKREEKYSRHSLLENGKESKSHSNKTKIKFTDGLTTPQKNSGNVACPCTDELKLLTDSVCACEGGVCKKNEQEPDLTDVKELLSKYLDDAIPSENDGPMKCFGRIYSELVDIQNNSLPLREAAAKLIEVLDRIDHCKEDCCCALHAVDLPQDENTDVKQRSSEDLLATIKKRYEKIRQTLVNRLNKISVTSVEIQCDSKSETSADEQTSFVCEFCGLEDCTCQQ